VPRRARAHGDPGAVRARSVAARDPGAVPMTAAPCAVQTARQRWPGCRIRCASAGPLDPAR
jgi:hypothetical protein